MSNIEPPRRIQRRVPMPRATLAELCIQATVERAEAGLHLSRFHPVQIK